MRPTPHNLALLALTWLVLLTLAACTSSRNFSPGVATTASGSVRSDIGSRPGNIAPDFTLKDLDGKIIKMSDFRGKPVVVNFWATWCLPCKEEMPAIEKAYQKYKGEVVFIGVDMKEDAETVRNFVKQYGYSWIFLLDSAGQAATNYRVSAVPETYFVDKDGIVRDFQIGAITLSGLESKIAKIR